MQLVSNFFLSVSCYLSHPTTLPCLTCVHRIALSHVLPEHLYAMKIQARAKALRGMRPGICLGGNKYRAKISCPEFSFGVSSYLDLEGKQMEKNANLCQLCSLLMYINQGSVCVDHSYLGMCKTDTSPKQSFAIHCSGHLYKSVSFCTIIASRSQLCETFACTTNCNLLFSSVVSALLDPPLCIQSFLYLEVKDLLAR